MPKEIKDAQGKVVATMLTEEDVQDCTLDGKTLAVIGYGSQGRGQSLCYRDSGVNVILGLRKEGASWKKALEDGWKGGENLFDIASATANADIVLILISDHVQKEVYDSQILPMLKPGKCLAFSHGFNVHFKNIEVPKDVDLVLLAPKGPGVIVRREYESGFGVPCLFAVEQDPSGNARNIVLAMARAIRATRPGVLETTFKDETESDLFGEQVILCGGIVELANAAYDTLIKHGFNPVLAYWEVFHELHGLIAPCAFKHGNAGMLRRVSPTARDGAIQSGKRVITEDIKTKMEGVLADIQSGEYARGNLARFAEKGLAAVEEPIAEMDKTMFETVGRQVRKVMWPNEYE